jgi:hypothetical protein
MTRKHSRAARSALAVCIVGVCQLDPAVVDAGVAFSSNSTAKWTFDPNTSGLPNSYTLNVNPPPSSSGMPVPAAYQYSKNEISGTTNSVARGSIGYVANSTTATFTLAAGTGVTQSDPGNLWPGYSSLKVDFDGYFKATSPGYGPSVLGYVSVAVGGTVGVGGSAQFIGNVNFYNASTGAAIRSAVNFSQTFSTAGPFSKTFTSSGFLSPSSFATNSTVRVKGYFEFRASNDVGPSDMNPIDVDTGGAPPTATWFLDADGAWSDAANWTPPPDSEIDDPTGSIPTVPNGLGQRARLANYFSAGRNISLDTDVTIGALDISTGASLAVNALPGSDLIFNAESGDATIQVRDVNGTSEQELNTPVVLVDTVDVIVDGHYIPTESPGPAGLLTFNQTISGQGSAGLMKHGEGLAALNANNTYVGGTLAGGGKLSANVTGSLGSGTVSADDGQLNYNAPHAAAPGIVVQATNNGQIDLGIVADPSETFSIGSISAISGSAAELQALTVGPPGNLQLAQGAMIAHETLDPNPLVGNPQGLGNTPLYIFGIANDFVGGATFEIAVGSQSPSPWRGFGSDRTARIFGSAGSLSNDRVLVLGDADLVALHETLTLNAQIFGVPGTSLTKRGKGTVAINHPNLQFQGPIHVSEGRLLANGGLFGVPTVSVQSGAALGGSGFIGGVVVANPGSILSPGGDAPGKVIGTLNVGSLALSGAILNFDMGVTSDMISVFGMDALTFGTQASTFNIIDTGSLVPGNYTLLDYSGAPLVNTGQLALSITAIGSFNLSLVYNSANTSIDLAVQAAINGNWNLNGAGLWNTPGNWNGGVPGGIGHSATFGPIITGPINIANNGGRTLSAITFDSSQSYTIGGNTITLDTTGEDAQINVLNGTHTILAPLILARDLTINTADASSINVSPVNAPTRVLTKTGLGSANLVNVRVGALHVDHGSLVIGPKPSPNLPNGTSVLRSLSIASGASMDLTNNSMIIDYETAGTIVSDTLNMIQNGRLKTTTPGVATRLGYGDNAELALTSFAGQSVDATSMLVKFTYGGDSDLDGDVDVGDLGRLATNWQSFALWTGGDSDYNAFVDVADLGILATNWQLGVGGPIGPSLADALASFGLPSVAVPEPAMLGLALLSLGSLRRRRR